MPRRKRNDEPGAFHHVMNRGIAKRPVFVGRAEVRFFLARLAIEVRRGELEVHGYCFLTTHFHLLLRSPRGNLSEAIRRVENPFVRWFNRRQRRDGPLFRGRFTSRRVDSDRYYDNVRSYIDYNPVEAGVVKVPADYPYGSAFLYRRGSIPRWLHEPPRGFSSCSPPLNEHATWVVERCLESPSASGPFDDFVDAAPSRVRRWMERKARVADGLAGSCCLLSPAALSEAVEQLRSQRGAWDVSPRSRPKDGWKILHIGLSRTVVGLSTVEASVQLEVPRSSAGQALLEHRHLLLSSPEYAECAAEVLQLGLCITFGAKRPGESRSGVAG